jgi:ParB-like chromosome segregation protein Spo0J
MSEIPLPIPITLSSTEREQLRVHDTAKQFPDMEAGDYWDFRANLIKHGMHDPILVSKDHKRLLDGRHRLRACDEVRRIEPVFAEFQGKPEDETNIIVALNLFRRHLNDKQRGALILKLLGPQWQKEAEERKAKSQFGTRENTVGVNSGQRSPPAGSDDVILKSTPPEEPATKSGQPTGKVADKLADTADLGQHTAKQLIKVRKAGGDKALDEIIRGEKDLTETAKSIPTKKRRPAKTLTFSEQVWRKWSSFLQRWSPADRRKVKELIAGYLKEQKGGA